MQIYTTTQKGTTFNIICKSESRFACFRHIVEIADKNGYILSRGKVCYINRTWEYYRFQTAIYKALNSLELVADKTENAKRIKSLKRQIDRKAGYVA